MKGTKGSLNPNQAALRRFTRTKRGVIVYLNKKFRKGIIGFVIKNGGTENGGEEIFQEGLFQLMEMLIGMKSFDIDHLERKLINLCKGLWYEEKKKQLKTTIDPILENEYSKIDKERLERENWETLKRNLVTKYLKKLRAKCRKILKFFYYENKSNKEIATLLKPKSTERSVITMKGNCLNDLENHLLIPYKNLAEYDI